MNSTLDNADRAILDRRRTRLDADSGPRVGDFVEFTDGVTRRISHIWTINPEPQVQTSDGDRFYLGEHGADFSGSLYPSVPVSSLTDTGTTRPGAVWFFHHDQWRAHNGVNTTIPFRVYRCTLPAPR